LVEPLSWALIRITVRPDDHPAAAQAMMGVQATANMALVKRGIWPAEPLAVALITLETLAGCARPGLFTRSGRGHRHRDDGHRLPPPAQVRVGEGATSTRSCGASSCLRWPARGGPYSLDRVIRKELSQMKRRAALLFTAALAPHSLSNGAWGQGAYPDRLVASILPYAPAYRPYRRAPGRRAAPLPRSAAGHHRNRPGAGGMLGAEVAATLRPTATTCCHRERRDGHRAARLSERQVQSAGRISSR